MSAALDDWPPEPAGTRFPHATPIGACLVILSLLCTAFITGPSLISPVLASSLMLLAISVVTLHLWWIPSDITAFRVLFIGPYHLLGAYHYLGLLALCVFLIDDALQGAPIVDTALFVNYALWPHESPYASSPPSTSSWKTRSSIDT